MKISHILVLGLATVLLSGCVAKHGSKGKKSNFTHYETTYIDDNDRYMVESRHKNMKATQNKTQKSHKQIEIIEPKAKKF